MDKPSIRDRIAAAYRVHRMSDAEVMDEQMIGRIGTALQAEAEKECRRRGLRMI